MTTERLRVWWVPQVPMKSFTVDVSSVAEGVKVMDVLAAYDAFQYENQIKPDYCNAGGLQRHVDGDDWEDWYDEETGEDDPAEWLKSTSGGDRAAVAREQVYVIKKRGRWLVGHSYATAIGYSFSWTANPFEARLYKNCPTLVPSGAKVVSVVVSDAIGRSLAEGE